ncbi:MAG: hybrid sensor histidine kinase/response regulator [Armatimonadetes bacterium]|nr:hybrid sensor histidine kinase/response regulator [Armatimonadota bacterium]
MGSFDPAESDEGRAALEDPQRALLNILEDFSAEKTQLVVGQRALLNILEDFEVEKGRLESTGRAMLNLLEDSSSETARLEAAQHAVLNILEDLVQEKVSLEAAERAVVNILEDSSEERARLETTQRAVLNILEDFDEARTNIQMVNQQLAKEVEERKRAERQIQRVNAELVVANQELEAFTYSVAHDLRAPLRHIDGFCRILLEEYASTFADESRPHLQRIAQSSKRMGQLVDDLLKLARVGRQDLSWHLTGLNALVQEVVAELRSECEGRQIDWRVGELPSVACDPGLMKQVFANLLSNALKFTRPRERAVIEVGTLAHSSELVLYVRDNGVGFDMKYADKLFAVFQRLHRQEEFEGTGVGLATAHRIVRRHGGRIWAEAEVGKGATFYFTLGDPHKEEDTR